MKIIAHCVGGLANMMSSAITGIFLAKMLKAPLYINWSCTNQCECPFDKIFDIIDTNIHMFQHFEFGKILKCWRTSRASYADQMDLPNGDTFNMFEIKSIKELIDKVQGDYDTIYVSDPIVPQYIPFVHFFQAVKFKQSILDKVPRLNVSCGLHIRGTDVLVKYNLDDKNIRSSIQNVIDANGKIFVCTDDAHILHLCETMNVITTKPKHAVVKMDETKAWATFGQIGASNVFNVHRQTEQVIEGIVDLLTLASMDKILGFITSRESTYFFLAKKCKDHKQHIFRQHCKLL